MSQDHRVREDLPAYALGILETHRIGELKSHLAQCEDCRLELESFEGVLDRLASEDPGTDPPPGLEARILRALPQRRGLRQLLLAAMVGTLIVGLAVGNVAQWSAAHQISGLSVAVLTGTGDAQGGFGTVVLDPEDHKGVLAVRGLHGADRYRLWVVQNGQWKSIGTFAADADGYGSLVLALPDPSQKRWSFCVSHDEGEAYHDDTWLLQGSI